MMSPDDGAVLTQRGGVGGGAAALLPPAERAAAFMASPRNSLSRGMRPPGAVGGGWAILHARDKECLQRAPPP